MFGNSQTKGYGRLIGLVAGAGGLTAIALGAPVLRRRALYATTILKKDHRLLSGLFWTLQKTTNAAMRKTIFTQIQNLIEIHTQAEEEIFYPAVQNLYTTAAQQQVAEARREHQRIKDLCNQVLMHDPNSFEFISKVNELKETLERHVEEEENEMFPLAQSNTSGEELHHLGLRIHDRKVQLKELIAA